MSLKDDLIKHQIFLQRLALQYARQLQKSLSKGVKAGINAIKKHPAGLNKKQLRGLKIELIEEAATIQDQQIGLLISLALYESEFIAKRLKENKVLTSVKVPPAAKITRTVSETKMSAVSGEKKITVPQAYDKFIKSKVSQIVVAVGDASLEPEEDKVLSVAEDKLSNLEKGLFAVGSLALVGTVVTQTASSVRQEVYEENNIPKVDWVTELDSDVCPDCEALGAGGPYPVDDTEIPPEHWNCRCVLVPTNE